MAERYLTPKMIDALGRLSLVAKQVVEGTVAGAHASPFHGYSAEFDEHRKYTAGDALRDLDWSVYARTDRYYIRRYREETNLFARIIVDGSGSMDFRYQEEGPTKFYYACCLAASIAYLLLQQRDAVGLSLLRDGRAETIPPSSKPGQLRLLLELMERARAGGEIALDKTIRDTAAAVRRAGMMVVISDLLDDEAALLDAMKQLKIRKNEVLLFHVLDPAEEDLPYRYVSEFVDMENGATLMTDPAALRADYRADVAAFRARVRKFCGDHHIRYVALATDQPLEKQLPLVLR
ncbi:MAG: DUF58 domain-containing protein [Planctomycetes bacterium]|nr:DUF58 domain-containing protein [Planctomycetota bacterium]